MKVIKLITNPMGIKIEIGYGLKALEGNRDAINLMCSWARTKQGHEFWRTRYRTGLDTEAKNIIRRQLIFQGEKIGISNLLEEI